MVILLAILLLVPTQVLDDGYDCLMRQLAFNYSNDIVLSASHGWSDARRNTASNLIAHGLKLEECNLSTSLHYLKRNEPLVDAQHREAGSTTTTLYVAPDGDDRAAGTLQVSLEYNIIYSFPPPLSHPSTIKRRRTDHYIRYVLSSFTSHLTHAYAKCATTT